jgi:hypothetical protein
MFKFFEKINLRRELYKRLNDFRKFEKDWDGYGGHRFSESVLLRSMSFVEGLWVQKQDLPTSVVPVAGGGSIQFEYHDGRLDETEVEVGEESYSMLFPDYEEVHNCSLNYVLKRLESFGR